MAEKKSELTKMKPAELEKIIIDLHNSDVSPAKIGLILRDKHGIPKTKLITKNVKKILDENKLPYLTEKTMAQDKINSLNVHILAHKHDYTAKRSLSKSLWAVKKLQ